MKSKLIILILLPLFLSMFILMSNCNSQKNVVLETASGNIEIEFFSEKAPKTIENFMKLVQSGFYDGTFFHRVIKGMLIQGGDPNTKTKQREIYGQGGPGYTIPAEFNDIKHEYGIVAMARKPDPNSGGSQFYIMLTKRPDLDNKYTVFGKVVKGMEAVEAISNISPENIDELEAKAKINKAYLVDKK